MPSMHLRLFGTPEVRVGNRTVKPGPKHLAMIAYLALQGRTSRRDFARKLWPDASDPLNSVSAARKVAHRTLGFEALGDDLESLSLNCDLFCDALSFRDGALRRDPSVWTLYGGPFLDGFRLTEWDQGMAEEFEEWVYTTREALGDARRDLATALARTHLERSEVKEALPYLETIHLQSDDPREVAARWLILCLGALGQPDRVPPVFARLTECLRDELGTEPTADTRAALEAARSGVEASLRLLERELQPRLPQAAPGKREAEDVPFVGRTAVLEWALVSLSVTRVGGARAVLIAGEPGAGKSRLAREIVRALNHLGTGLLVTFGKGERSGLPLGALDQALRGLIRARPATLETMNPAWRDALARLLPDVIEAGAPALEPELERRYLFEAIRALLSHPEMSTVLVVDDLQWVDPSTVACIERLLQQPPEHGLILIATQRSTEAPVSDLAPLRELLVREDIGVMTELEPLSSEAIKDMAESLGRSGTNPERLREASGGNPLYVLELLRARDETGSKRVQDLIRERIRAISNVARQVLEAASVLGSTRTPGLIRRTSGRALEEVADALEQLARAGLVRFDDERVLFGHDLTREVARSGLSSVRRSVLELRAARAHRDQPALAALHYREARDAWDEEDIPIVVNAFLAAGSSNALRGDLETGFGWFEDAFQAATNDAQRVRVIAERARALDRYGRHAEALEALDSAETLLGGTFDAVDRANVWVAQATILSLKTPRLTEAHALAERVLREVEGLEREDARRVRGDALNASGTVARREGAFARAAELFKRSLTIRRALDDPARVASALNNLGLVYYNLGDARAEKTLLECLEIREKLGDLPGSIRTLGNLTGVYNHQQRRHVKARLTCERAMALATQLKDPWSLTLCAGNLGVTHFFLEHPAEALEHYQHGLKLAEEHNYSDFRDAALYNIAELHALLGDVPASLAALTRLDEGSTHARVETKLLRAEIAYAAEETDFAIIEAEWALEAARASGQSALERRSMALLAIYRDDREAARLVTQGAPSTNESELPALALRAQGVTERDPALLHEALELAANPLERRRVLEALIRLEPARAPHWTRELERMVPKLQKRSDQIRPS